MPPLDNPRHERFAQGLAEGKTQIEAYREAGYRPDDGAANRLSGKVRHRVAELQGRAAARTEVTIETLVAELDEARALALGLGQASAAVAATKEKGVLLGLRVEKTENDNRNTSFVALVPDVADTNDQWQRAHVPSPSSSGDLNGRKPH